MGLRRHERAVGDAVPPIPAKTAKNHIARNKLQSIRHFRDWRAHGASSSARFVMRKTFLSGRAVETSDKLTPEIEAFTCWILEAQCAPAAPVPARRDRQS